VRGKFHRAVFENRSVIQQPGNKATKKAVAFFLRFFVVQIKAPVV
jgi:hypothetical protein